MLKWIAFKDRLPPPVELTREPGRLLTKRVLVTNNLTARDAAGQPSHVWFVRPMATLEGRTGWTAYDDGDRRIHDLTHWCDPLAELEKPDA